MSTSTDPDKTAGPEVVDTPPQRVHDFKDLVNAALAALVGVAVVLASMYLRGISTGVEADVQHAGSLVGWLVELPMSLLQQAVTVCIVVSVLIQLVLHHEWVQSAVSVLTMFVGYVGADLASRLIMVVGSDDLVQALGSGVITAGPLLPDVFTGLTAFLTAAGPHRLRGTVKWGWNTLIVTAVLFVVVSVDSISGVMLTMAMGRLVGLVVRFLFGTQNKGAWGMQIVQALSGVGLTVTRFTRREGAHGPVGDKRPSLLDDRSPLSRIYDAETSDGTRYLVSVCDEQTRTVGYLNQVWRWIRMASGIPLRTDRSMSASTHHHFDLLLSLRNIGLPTAHVYARAESGESSIIVFETDAVPQPVNWNTVSDDDLTSLMRYLEAANGRGITHRDISPASVARIGDDMVLTGWQNGDDASLPANVAIDRVQLLAALSCRLPIDRVVRTARDVWGDETLVSLAPFLQNVAVSKETKGEPTWNRQLLTLIRNEVGALAPLDDGDQNSSATLSRFNAKSMITLVLVIAAVYVMFTQINPSDFLDAAARANPWMAALGFLFGVASWAGSGLALGVFIDGDRRTVAGVLASQAAGTFTTVSMPAGVGPAVINLQYVRKCGYRNAAATAIMSAVVAVQALTIVVLLIVVGVFTGRNTLSGMIPTNLLVAVIGLAALAVSLVMIIPPTRRLVIERLLPVVLAYTRQLLDQLTQPGKIGVAFLGWLFQNVTLGLSFWAALMAFGQYTNPIETTFIYVLTNTLASAVPTPGGLGAIEAALALGFTSLGVPYAVALSATLLFRLLTYWLRLPIGAAAMRWMNSRGLL